MVIRARDKFSPGADLDNLAQSDIFLVFFWCILLKNTHSGSGRDVSQVFGPYMTWDSGYLWLLNILSQFKWKSQGFLRHALTVFLNNL